jgi:hypothetical protein
MSKRTEKPPPPDEPSMTTRGLSMTDSYELWLECFARSEQMTLSTLIDRALASYAKQVGFETPPERVS